MFDTFCIPMDVPPSGGSPDAVLITISSELNIPLQSILDHKRGKDDICFARQLSIYILHTRVGMSAMAIARMFRRSYCSVFNALKSISNYRTTGHPRGMLVDRFITYNFA